ncbi:molybdate ABC transporter substrate-binding protein [bacterium]|nr:molybdate ABC transporter substrate-binding protein [bacterium]
MSAFVNRRSFLAGVAALGALAAVTPVVSMAADAKSGAKDASASSDGEAKRAASSRADGSAAADAPKAKPGELQIFAANSLEKALPEVQKLYSAAHPEVTFADSQFKASGDLVEQMKAGAVPDVLITASTGTMDKAQDAGLVDEGTRQNMFNNDLVIVVCDQDDYYDIQSIADVADETIKTIAIGDSATVPAGKYANQALASVGLYSDASGDGGSYDETIAGKVNLADKVGTAAKWVSTRDCQVGFVYSSDVYRYDGIKVAYTCPADSHKPIVYPGAVAADAVNADTAADFLDFCMTDPDALQVWSQYGFEVAEEA